jgi:hypothetical protein
LLAPHIIEMILDGRQPRGFLFERLRKCVPVLWHLRRAHATTATNAGVDEDTVGKLLNHGGRSVTSRYIKTSYRGCWRAAQEDISAHLVKALGSPRGLA